jgi:AraC family transcriptional regulator
VSGPRRSQAEYERRLHAVTEYIDRHLDSDLDLATLSGVAHFSEFHFHRLFRALVGESLGDYVRRRRLESAAVRLRSQPRVAVLDIALAHGFGSAEAFTRAFRTRYECSPSEWRNSKYDQVARNAGQSPRLSIAHPDDTLHEEFVMKVKLIDREDVRVAYLRHTGPYGPDIGRFWMETVASWMETNDLMGRDRYGIGLDDPSVTDPAKCRYDACVPSPEGEVLSGSPHHKILPGGRYAALAFEGTGEQIPAAWDALLRDWLPQSGLQLDTRPFFEFYPGDGKYDPKTGIFACDICVPVAAL